MACYFCQDKCRLNDERKLILLPCEIGVVCSECFDSSKPIEKTFCKVCKSRHDCDLVDIINDNQLNLDKINRFFEQHKKEYESLQELLNNRDSRLNDHIQNIKELLEQQLQNPINYNEVNSLSQIIERIKIKLQNQLKLELNDFNLDMQKFGEFQRDQHILFSNQDKYSVELKDNTQKILNHLSEMSILKSKLKSEFFEKLNIIKNETGINNVLNNICGDIVCAFRIENQRIKLIELTNMSEPRAMTVSKCDKLFITDVKDNSVAILDSNLEVIKYKKLNIEFHGMNGISNDREHHVLISNSGDHRLVCLSQNFEIYKTIGEYGKLNGHYDYPTHIAYHNRHFYVLDSKNSRIQRICTTKLTYDKVIDLYKTIGNDKLDQPKAMAVMNNVLAVCDGDSHVYLYDFDGTLFETLKYDNVGSLCFANGYLFIHTSDGRLICHEKDEHTLKFSFRFNRFDPELNHSSDYMVYFKGKLLILFGHNKCLAVI